MQKHTHREYIGWIHWLDEQWDKPSRTDHYLMQISAQIRGLFSKGGSININSSALSFRKVEPVEPEVLRKREMEKSKGHWKSAVGYKD